jgi:hypothetical protein
MDDEQPVATFRMRYSRAYVGMTAFGVIVGLGAAAFALYSGLVAVPMNKGATFGAGVLALVFLASVSGMAIRVAFTRLEVTDEGLEYRSPLGVTRLAWDEIKRLTNCYPKSHFIVSGGRKSVRVDHYYAENDLGLFAEVCKKRLSAEVYGEAFEKPLSNSLTDL